MEVSRAMFPHLTDRQMVHAATNYHSGMMSILPSHENYPYVMARRAEIETRLIRRWVTDALLEAKIDGTPFSPIVLH